MVGRWDAHGHCELGDDWHVPGQLPGSKSPVVGSGGGDRLVLDALRTWSGPPETASEFIMIRTLLLLYCFAAPALASYQSLTIPANASVKLAIPSGAPFTLMGNYRLSMRLHDWTVPISGSIPVFNSVNANIRVALFANNVLCGANYGADIENEYSNWECVNISGMNDVVLRLQRFGATYPSDGASAGSGSTVFEVQNLANGQMLTSYCGYDSVGGNQFPCPISAATPTSDAGSATFGGTASYSLAWLKWFGTTVPPGSPLENES